MKLDLQHTMQPGSRQS